MLNATCSVQIPCGSLSQAASREVGLVCAKIVHSLKAAKKYLENIINATHDKKKSFCTLHDAVEKPHIKRDNLEKRIFLILRIHSMCIA